MDVFALHKRPKNQTAYKEMDEKSAKTKVCPGLTCVKYRHSLRMGFGLVYVSGNGSGAKHPSTSTDI